MKNESCKVVLFIIKVVLFVFSILKKWNLDILLHLTLTTSGIERVN